MRVLAVFAVGAAVALSVWPGIEDLSLGVTVLLGYGLLAVIVEMVRR